MDNIMLGLLFASTLASCIFGFSVGFGRGYKCSKLEDN